MEADSALVSAQTWLLVWVTQSRAARTQDSRAGAAAREVREELGIETPVGPLLVADWVPHPGEGDKLLLIFDGGTLTADQLDGIRLQADELDAR
jgi:8-oxo-dGTP diphosphatase